ncbi:MAG TPA: SAM-dependent methyltransferase [Thermoanaerobaculia bacterium]|nr:SAM-dependent methyltransferase [Thermoanaerobaculia bacterium]
MTGSELVPFSRCGVWRSHRDFFLSEGIEAWNGRVPFYITSNPYLAHAYATIILRFLEDLQAGDPGEGPVYVLELGAGTGAFSYQVIRCLMELTESCPMLAADLCYVMSDISERNVAFWQSHPMFAPFLQQGVLDFALFDIESSSRLELKVSERVVERTPESPSAGPLIVIANYVFDAVPPDFFRVADGRLVEVLVPDSLALPPNDSANESLEIARIEGSRESEVEGLRYEPEPVDRVLREQAAAGIDGGFLFPSIALQCLARLQQTVSPEILLLVADKGTLNPAATPEPSRLTLGLHGGSASTLLDFQALERFARGQGGDAYACKTEGIVTGIYSLEVPFVELPETRLAIAQFLGAFNPGHIYDVVRYCRETRPAARLETLVAVLELTLWDPVVFDQFFDVLLASLPYASSYGLEKLTENLHRVVDNFFYLPSASDTFQQVGVLLQEMRRHADALQAHKASLSWYGESARTFYNMGLCCHALQRQQEAVGWFQEALRLRPDFIEVRGWIAQIEHDLEL